MGIMLLVLLFMWFYLYRTQKKQQKQREELFASLKPGDSVVTIGGLHGIIHKINEEKQCVEIDCEGGIFEFDKASIRTVNKW